ncbi:MAG: Gfo/Idh/MocA family oxidoreductase [Planctomycetes bacterium]|nr:Gfo/Idh/MocA family oxidoreductase [Planctomycetota bacterium]
MKKDNENDAGRNGDITRRDFVRTTAAVASAGALIAPTWAYAGGDDTIRLGFIGCGGRGTSAAGQALSADPGVELVAMGDVFEDRLSSSHEHLQSKFGDRVDVPAERRFIGFDAYRKVIESDVDVVILTTPPHFRPAHLKAAIDAGKHVFCEKPMAVDATGVRSVLESAAQARRKGISLVSGFCWRYSAPNRASYAKIHDGAIGDVVSMHTTYHTNTLGKQPRQDHWSDMEWQLRNWWHFTWLSGDHIVEQACHSIDWINWAMNGVMPIRATALGGRQVRKGPESGNVYDHFSVIYEYENGARCFHTCRQMPNCSGDNTSYIMGTKGTCLINPWSPSCVIDGESPWRYEGDSPDMYQVEHNELFASIRSGQPMNDGIWMANSTMMAIMGRMAAYTGKTITWEEALYSPEDLTPPEYAFGDIAVGPVAMPGETEFLPGEAPMLIESGG